MISVRNVTKRFGDFVALDGVSVEVSSGALLALLGPSGSGKSTLLRVIAGLERPDTGDVFISGREATRLRPQERGVGFVFQRLNSGDTSGASALALLMLVVSLGVLLGIGGLRRWATRHDR